MGEELQRDRWREHFEELLNRPVPTERPDMDAKPRRISIRQLDNKEVERLQDQTTYQQMPSRLMQEFRLTSFILF